MRIYEAAVSEEYPTNAAVTARGFLLSCFVCLTETRLAAVTFCQQ